MNSLSTSITLGERVCFEGGVSKSLVVIFVEGITGAVVSTTEEIGSSRGGVFMKTSVLATREVGSVIMGSGSMTNVEESVLVITIKPVAVGTRDVEGVKTDSLVDSS